MLTTLLTPEHLDDVNPSLANRVEQSRRIALDWLRQHSYQLVTPPMIEHIETLTGNTKDLDQKTFKISDTLSARTLGIRADHTPQIARYDRTYANNNAVRRYCYCGHVLYTKPDQPWESREKCQLGAELFGVPPLFGDWEVITLVIALLELIGIKNIKVDIGDANLLTPLITATPDTAPKIARDISNRDLPALQQHEAAGQLQSGAVSIIESLIGDKNINAKRTQLFTPPLDEAIFSQLFFIRRQLQSSGVDVRLNFSHLGSYGYHAGLVFQLYDNKEVICQGGRYQTDHEKNAVGFSLDLLALADKLRPLPPASPVAVPIVKDDATWWQAVQRLQRAGRAIKFVSTTPTKPPLLEVKNKQWKLTEK